MKKNKWFLNGGRGSGRPYRLSFEYYENKVADLEKENAELKEQNRKLLESCEGATMMYEHLTKAKEFLKKFMPYVIESYLKQDISNIKLSFSEIEEAEQFLSEVEK